jgi:hypothetical protein
MGDPTSIKEAFDDAYDFLNPVLQRGMQTTQQLTRFLNLMLTNRKRKYRNLA